MKNTKESKQASWGGRFSEAPSELMLRFGESVSFDRKLAFFDIQGSCAQAEMLASCGIISEEECSQILRGLEKIADQIADGKFKWDMALEDVHMNIEQALTKIAPAAAKLHTGRSRNDQVATDMRLFFKSACLRIQDKIESLMGVLVSLAEKNSDILIPGYTHLQRAQPVGVAHHILAWVEMLSRDLNRFKSVYESANVSPLGSGAIAGTTLPVNREISAEIMGFTDAKGRAILTQNSMDAVADRDVFLEFLSACSIMAVHFSRMAEDVIIWNTSEFAFIKLPDTFTTGSSLMPQKKNPDSFELLRGKSARIIGDMNTMFTLVKGLPLTYNRDLQEDKPAVFDAYEQAMVCLDVVAGALSRAEFNAQKCAAAVADPLLLATDLADYLVMRGVAFRKAHHYVGGLVALAEKTNTPINELSDAAAKKVCPHLGEDWKSVFDLKRAISMREKAGMPGKKQTAKRIAYWKKLLAK
ncbi:MAG: argininosuccinate lyase [Opitutales bacterium]|nr:argininosuccinate lyase [Opitutales bacterium]